MDATEGGILVISFSQISGATLPAVFRGVHVVAVWFSYRWTWGVAFELSSLCVQLKAKLEFW